MNAGDWQALTDGMLEAVWVVDPLDLRIIAANLEAERLAGTARDALVGVPVIDLAGTPEDKYFWEDVAAGISDGIHSETLLRRADGSVLHVDRRVSRIRVGTEAFFVVGMRDKSDQRRVEDELEKLVAELRATLESTADGILVTDFAGAIRGYNHRFAEMWKLPEALQTRRDDAGVFAWMAAAVVDVDHYLDRLGFIARSPLLETTDTVVLRSGAILERVAVPQYARNRPIGRVYSFRDITQRLADQERLQLAAQVFESSLDAIFIASAEFRLVAANPNCALRTGFHHDEIIGRAMFDILVDGEGGELAQRIAAGLARDGFWEGEACCRRKDGETCPGLVSLVRVADEENHPRSYIGFFKDLSERVAAARRIEELAYNDALTGLPNRVLLAERINFALQRASRDDSPFAILFIDLDRFKQINDSLGHMFGDRVLVEVAERIKACLRQADTAARLGGDEFVLILFDADARGAELTAQRILDALAAPLPLDDMNFSVTCSIGIALYPGDGQTMDDLIKNADAAMYRAKERGRAGFHFYQAQMNIELLSRMKLDHAMREALARDRFRLHYQPQVALPGGTIFGAEALIRWEDPELGSISPGRFIPVAEESGFIIAIGRWVLQEAVRQAAEWRAAGVDLLVAINVSALQFQQSDFVDSVAGAIAAAGLPPDRLEIELTESILVRDADEALLRLQALAALGVKMSIDDFGTGYSSLSYLKRFPIDKLKVDRSFVSGLPGDDSDAAIVRAIVELGHALHLQVIAEGVETDPQRDFLVAAGCDQFQGFLCSRAVPATEFVALLQPAPKFAQTR